jgi:hypothetical protein
VAATEARGRKKSAGRQTERLDLALTLGVSPRRLDGWEPAEIVEYEYDENGRLARALSTREPEFSEDDVALLLAHIRHQRSIQPHGYTLDEAISPEADPSNRKGAYYFRAGAPYIDFAEKARLDEQRKFREAYPDADLSAYIFPIEKVERVRRA